MGKRAISKATSKWNVSHGFMGQVGGKTFLNDYYNLSGPIRSATKIGVGHIHASFKVFTDEKAYFLQQINDKIFPVEQLTQNTELVLDHLSSHDQELLQIPTLLCSKSGKRFVKLDNQYWRLFEWQEGLKSYDNPADPAQLRSGAKAYGFFDQLLKDLDHSKLSEVIPQFQSLSHRLNQLTEATQTCKESKLEEVTDLLMTVSKLKQPLSRLEEAWKTGMIPTRVVHNDTKFNNVMFDKAGEARCVVDLDTVMPGILHFDFGDGLRTTSTLANEDEGDISRIKIDVKRHTAFMEGFLEGFGDEISSSEEALIPLAGPYMAFIMGVRFLKELSQWQCVLCYFIS